MKKRMNKFTLFITGLISLLFLSVSLPIQAANQSDPVAMLQSIADNMITQLRKNKATLKTKPTIVYQLAERYVVPYADLPEMSKRVLPPHIWRSATASERSQFQKQFKRLLMRTYASALTSYQDQEVKFYPIRGGYQGKQNVQVRSEITGGNSGSVSVTYRLLNESGKWRLYDMSVEGVSLIDSFRSQFADILSDGNMSTLLKRLSSHNEG